MSPSPLSPRLLKGAIVAIDLATSRHSTIVFQYNPETIMRLQEPQWPEAKGAVLPGCALHRHPGDYRKPPTG